MYFGRENGFASRWLEKGLVFEPNVFLSTYVAICGISTFCMGKSTLACVRDVAVILARSAPLGSACGAAAFPCRAYVARLGSALLRLVFGFGSTQLGLALLGSRRWLGLAPLGLACGSVAWVCARYRIALPPDVFWLLRKWSRVALA